MATNTAVKFYKVASLPSTLETGAIYFVTGSSSISGGTGTATAGGDIYVATSTSAAIKYTSDVQSVTFADAEAGSPYTGGALTVTDKYGISKTYNVASQDDLSALAAAMSAAIADLDVNGYAQATVASGSGSPANSAVVTIKGIKEEDGKISADSNNDTAVTIAGGNNITVTTSGNTITIAGENGGVQSVTATTGGGIAVGGTSEDPTVGIDSAYVDGTLSTSNKLATQSTVTTAVGDAIADLDGTATIASESNGVVTLKTGVSETDGKIANDSGTDITLAKVATTGTAADVSIVDSGNNFTAENVEGALAELATKVTSVFTYKGSCTYENLPSSGQQVGDTWNVTDAHGGYPAGTNYTWNGTDWDPLGGDVSNYKTKQSAVSDPTADGNATSFIDTISQNANGEITVTKKTVQTASASQAGLMSSTDYTKLSGIAEGAQVNVLEGVQINGTDLSIDSNKKVNIVTNTAYDATTNKIATMSDIDAAQLSWQEFN